MEEVFEEVVFALFVPENFEELLRRGRETHVRTLNHSGFTRHRASPSDFEACYPILLGQMLTKLAIKCR
jgi:hypothetical protein